MRVTVHLFADFRRTLGWATREWEVAEGTTLGDLWGRVAADRIAVAPLMARNQAYAAAETPVAAGDEVAFFPPVAGG